MTVCEARRPLFVVGAYASQPTDPVGQAAYLELLGSVGWIDGLEVPYPGAFAGDPAGFARQLPTTLTQNTVTAIPGTMGRLNAQPLFGLASPDQDGRAAALAFTEDIRRAVLDLAEHVGRPVARYVQLHSAPTQWAEASALSASLEEVLGWDWSGSELVIEHCDRWSTSHPPDKGFLSLEEEVQVAQDLGVGIHLNWGRSCIEARGAQGALQAVQAARSAGVLAGLIFSGASGQSTQYGGPWADAHLPAAPDEPKSLLGLDDLRECSRAATDPTLTGRPATYLGAKICVPADAPLQKRLAMLATIAEAMG